MRWLVGIVVLIVVAFISYGMFAHAWVAVANERNLGDWVCLGPLSIGGVFMLVVLAIFPRKERAK